MSQILCPIVTITVSMGSTHINSLEKLRHGLVKFYGNSKLVIIFLINLYDYHIKARLFSFRLCETLKAKGVSQLKGMI